MSATSRSGLDQNARMVDVPAGRPPASDLFGRPDDDFDDATARFEPPPFDPLDDPTREPTPALLAARAEPLGSPSGLDPVRRPKRSSRGGRPTRPNDAVRSGQARLRPAQKPKEPSKLLLGLGMLAIAVVGLGVAYLVTRGGGEPAGEPTAVGDTVTTVAERAGAAEDPGVTASTVADAAASPTAADAPYVIFDEAAMGPIDADTPYTLAVGAGPESANYQLLVDEVPAADPAPELPPATFAPGRHLLVVNITSPAGDTATSPVLVYALDPQPVTGHLVNLSSVSIDGEGWIEAVRQFDEFVAAGHTEARLMPSAWFPSLPAGYWNIVVGGFADSAAATSYCEQFGLAVPGDCFARYLEPPSAGG